ncbi:probable dolichyl pyrophosphate Glc1Man9GlcNAc2 alpha-1,3-glucosyltransferase [Drosophila novamexicana]|uniref:probable dolichyl pyrophosphate Glc1Man9GlcNAc2 alpha-1,3-glucosyltransferase n=1 Tax=Drosophila novamexicana TaxID=47314 RepID=UPI0011E5DB28|nr:probable dolichyl pyrophosphate Glc1Man9GlcNAc2 alpha-1,3-glucosyltransferase [Drosophila novamexicana]
MRGYFWQLVGISCAIKVLLLPAYYSTDFEVHRNWLAITHSLPLNRWYLDATSEWTLDYPPFFAYFEWLLSQVAKYVDPNMLIVQNLNYASVRTVHFQRISVIIMDLIYMLGVRCCMSALGIVPATQKHIAGCMLLFLNVGLIFVDHIHFQYNGFLFGILLLSISALLRQRYLWSAFAFAVLLNFKHIFLYMAPAFGVYLLKFYCLAQGNFGQNTLRLLAVGLVPFVLSFGPFWHQLPQLMSRLFPFKRGLTHAYWAPNIWALYNAADKVAVIALKRTTESEATSTSSGLVQEVQHVVLPTITPSITFALTFLFMLPILIKLFMTRSREHARLLFLRAVVLCSCSSFMFGWHVHEKAILMCLIPLCLLALLDRRDARFAYILAVAGYYSLFPLLFEVDLLVPRYSLYMTYMAMMYGQLERVYKCKPNFHLLEWIYFLGFITIPIYEHIVSRLLGLHLLFPFMPLLLTSVYSGLGVLYFYVRYYICAMDLKWPSFGKRRVTQIKSSATKRKRKTK